MAKLKIEMDYITDEVIVIKKKVFRRNSKNRITMRKSTPQELQREREDKLYRQNWRISNSGSKAKSQRIANLNLKYGI